VPTWAADRVDAATTEALEQWGFRVLEADNLDDVFRE
jgi:hypothetical protein